MIDQPQYEVFREIWIITQRRDGAIFKTRYSHDDWVPMGTKGDGADLLYIAISDDSKAKNPRRKGVTT